MCGRVAISLRPDEIRKEFGFDEPVDSNSVPETYNRAPSQDLPVIRLDKDGKKEIVAMEWGLVPRWTKDLDSARRPINARAETVLEKPMFRDAFKNRRGLIPVSGFYEWKKVGSGKVPMFIRLKEAPMMALACIWESWRPKGQGTELLTCCILTTTPNDLLKSVHHRMACVVAPEAYDRWLDPAADPENLLELLEPFPADRMEAYEVSKFVNSPANDAPKCMEPA